MSTTKLTRIFVASGFSSSLFSSLIPFIQYSTKATEVTGIVRPTDDPKKLKHQEFLIKQGYKILKSTDIKGTVQKFFAARNDTENWRILWFSTLDDAETLRACADIAPTLAIGSGALIDYYTKTIPTSNPYIDGKLRMALTPGVTTLCCGFFLENNPYTPNTPSGLHRDTTRVLLGIDRCSETDPEKIAKWYAKAYFVTPKTLACETINRWIENPHDKLNRWFHVGSTRTYSRAELAKLLGTTLPEGISPQIAESSYEKYADDFTRAFHIKCDTQNVLEALVGVKEWGSRHLK